MDFELKTVTPFKLLCAEKRMGFPDIPQFAGEVVPQVCAKATELGLKTIAPETFIYHFDEKGFVLQAGVPIEALKGDPAPFKVVTTEPYKCLTCVYKGSMKTIAPAWDKLMHEVRAKGLTSTKQSREIYHRWVEFDSAENETELQVGVV